MALNRFHEGVLPAGSGPQAAAIGLGGEHTRNLVGVFVGAAGVQGRQGLTDLDGSEAITAFPQWFEQANQSEGPIDRPCSPGEMEINPPQHKTGTGEAFD
jgi:hypothetical protein